MIVRSICRLYRRTNSNRLRYKLQQLQELSLSGSLDHGSTEDSDSFSTILSSSVEARLWFLTRSKLIDPFACRGLKSLNTAHNTCFGSHEMLDEPLDDAGDLLLGGDETPILDAYGAAMELGETDDLDLFQEHCLSGIADEGEELLDGDLFWEHSQDEVAYDQVMLLNDDTSTLMSDDSHAKIFGALAFESGNDGVR